MSAFDIDPEEEVPTQHHEAPRHAGTVGRVLPHSLEAEEYLLSCCLLDGADVLSRCEEARVRPDSFYDPKHGVIFEILLDLYRGKKLIDVSILAEELKTRKQLDQIGGYAFLLQVSERIPTTAQAGYFIEKVREQSLLREIIRSATGMVEDCYGFSGGIEDFVRERRTRIEDVFDGVASAAALAAECRFDPKAPITETQVAFHLGGVPLCTVGNLTNIVAASGVGKSAVVDAMIAAAMKHPKDTLADCIGFSADNTHGLPILHFDTEQSQGDYQRLLHRSLRRSRAEAFPAWFQSYHLTGKTPLECREILRTTVRQAARKFGGIFAVFIDGWGDMCMDPNDTQECFPFVAEMHAMAIRHNCPIIGVLHLNPGSEGKSRGHLGSQLDRKAETVLKLEMNEELVTALYSTKKRGAPILKADGPRFAWDREHEMHRTVGDWAQRAAESRAAKRDAKRKENPGAFPEKYSREEQISFYPAANAKAENRSVIFRKAKEAAHISDSSLDRLRLQFLKDGWILSVDGQYRRTAEGDLWAARRPRPEPKNLIEFPSAQKSAEPAVQL